MKDGMVANDQRPSKPQGGAKNAYLLTYNALSAALWAGVLYQTVKVGGHEVANARKAGALFGGNQRSEWQAIRRGLGSGRAYDGLEGYTRGVQTLAGLEVLHSLVGMFTLFIPFPAPYIPPFPVLLCSPYFKIPIQIIWNEASALTPPQESFARPS
jgi:hypothetical protein